MHANKPRPILILIRDGWGYRKEDKDNAIFEGNTHYTDELMEKYPNILIGASGSAVGLPEGFMGNSEVGHLTIGSGRKIEQSMTRIDNSIRTGDFRKNRAFLQAIDNCKKNSSTMHIIGLLQDEGVHSMMTHLFAVLDMIKDNGLYKVCVHCITDGRDAPVDAGAEKIARLKKKLSELGIGRIATISGRYYSMDRDKRWDRTEKAYRAIVDGKADCLVGLPELYSKGETDEFIVPRKADWYSGIHDNDSVIFFNFRTDRTRQLTQAIVEEDFSGFGREKKNLTFAAMTQYYRPMDALVAFEDLEFKNLLGKVLSDNGLRQLRISETEKYAHVTFFFNGENEVPYPNEDRILINSPKVPTYDQKPEMSAFEVTERVIAEIDKNIYDVIVMNIVNGDMVGHTGVKEACLKAVEVVDECLHKIISKILEKDGVALIFADHGNIEDQTPRWRTSHTTNPVPFIVVSNREFKLKEKGGLKDIAPTVLKLLGIEKPNEMAGESLII